jgi:hypothetical protein
MRKLIALFTLLFVISMFGCGGGSNPAPPIVTPIIPPPPPSTASPDVRADYLVGQMTLDEKLSMIHGGALTDWWNHTLPHGAVGWNPAITRLGIPDLYMADGSVGVGNNVGQATALPSSIASAATWDLAQAYKYGQVIGAESRAFGINVNLGGNVNLSGREPRNGRTFETKGEDPLLAGKINAAHIKAIQDQFVIAGVKHFALNDQGPDARPRTFTSTSAPRVKATCSHSKSVWRIPIHNPSCARTTSSTALGDARTHTCSTRFLNPVGRFLDLS